MSRGPNHFATEADLCAAFIAAVRPTWTAYAETAGWDILLVAADGTQIGVQAKLKFNMKVLSQAIEGSWMAWSEEGPDFRAVLVPEGGGEDICAALGLQLIHARGDGRSFDPNISAKPDRFGYIDAGRWHFWNPVRRHKLPEFVPDVVAGASGPVQLTRWKVAALRVFARLELRGHVTRKDFRDLGIDSRRWLGPGSWLRPGPEPGTYVAAEKPSLAAQHPDVWPQVLADEAKSMPRTLLSEVAA